MQVSINAEDTTMNVRSRRPVPAERGANREASPGAPRILAPPRGSIRLIDLSQELPSGVDFASQSSSVNPSLKFGLFDDPFSPTDFSPTLLDMQAPPPPPRDPFDLSHLKPPPTFARVASVNASSQSTPSLPIAVASRGGNGSERGLSSDLSTSSDRPTLSPSSMRLSSSADSALAALPPPPPPPGVARLPDSDEVVACGCSDHPYLPPRAPLQPADRPRILPIIENGQRTSYTHYWVIPPRTKLSSEGPSLSQPQPGRATSPSQQCSASMDSEHYVNLSCPPMVTRSASMPPRTRPRERRYVKRPSGDTHTHEADLLGCATNRAFVDDVMEAPPVLDFEDSNFAAGHVVSSVESDSSSEAVPSPEERQARIVQVRESVHGVTDEEALMILQTHRWEVQRSIRLLKVEQLFRLGVASSKNVCKEILDDAGGDLALASSRLISHQVGSALPSK